jgi:hypothetical protein
VIEASVDEEQRENVGEDAEQGGWSHCSTLQFEQQGRGQDIAKCTIGSKDS